MTDGNTRGSRIFVVGSGVVGAATGLGFRAAGHRVTFVDNPLYGIRGGAPYGGVCLPKDTRGFLGFAAGIGVDTPLLRAVVETNDVLEHVVSREADAVSRDAPRHVSDLA